MSPDLCSGQTEGSSQVPQPNNHPVKTGRRYQSKRLRVVMVDMRNSAAVGVVAVCRVLCSWFSSPSFNQPFCPRFRHLDQRR